MCHSGEAQNGYARNMQNNKTVLLLLLITSGSRRAPKRQKDLNNFIAKEVFKVSFKTVTIR